MKFKEILIPFTLAVLSTFLIQHFFFPDKSTKPEAASDLSFIAPVSKEAAQPLDFEVDFFDAKPTDQRELVTVYTGPVIYEFSNYGAIVNKLEYKRMLAGQESIIQTVSQPAEKEDSAFLLGFNGLGVTPYYYKLTENKTTNGITNLTYKAESEKVSVVKQFMIYHDSYKLDLHLTVTPKDANTDIKARIFFPAPWVSYSGKTEAVNAVLLSDKKSLEKKPIASVNQMGKIQPSLFGLEDHYFLNCLIKDNNGFAQRAYYKLLPVKYEETVSNSALAILQTGIIKKPMAWNLSFYMGPKEASSLNKVDPILEGVLDYGWFAPISRILLALLIFFYGILKNYGLAIIALTLLIRLILVPFTLSGEKNRKKHLDAQRELKYIEQKFKNDPEALARHKAQFAKEHGIPGMLGCLPLLLQIPVFIGLQRVLANAIELYKAPFLWIPDLSSPDPYYIIPALVGIGMMMQTASSGDPRQKVTNILIALIIAGVTSNISAGLGLFICVSTLLGVLQTYIQKVFGV